MKIQPLKLNVCQTKDNMQKRTKITGLVQNKLNVLDYSALFVLILHVLTDVVQVLKG